MKSISSVGLPDVLSVYSGFEGDLWELVMGQQIHIGGFQSSMDLAERAGLAPGLHGVDLCCCTGAGMRFLVRFRKAGSMQGVDATPKVIERGRQRCEAENLEKRITFTLADVCSSGLPSAGFDFVWGEDAWCYVQDKPTLIAEAARLAKVSGVIAFTDWMEGQVPMTAEEANRCLGFMKFPNILNLVEYTALLEANGCAVRVALDTGRFARFVPLYLDMIERQLTYDALRIVGFDTALAETLIQEMRFLQTLAEAGKIIQGLIVAHKTSGPP